MTSKDDLAKLRKMIMEHDQSFASLDEIMATAAQLLLEAELKGLQYAFAKWPTQVRLRNELPSLKL